MRGADVDQQLQRAGSDGKLADTQVSLYEDLVTALDAEVGAPLSQRREPPYGLAPLT